MTTQAQAVPTAENRRAPQKAGAVTKADTGKRLPIVRFILFGAVLAAALFFGVSWFIRLQTYEETDDAYVTGHYHPLSFRISGTVSEVLVDDNQVVKAGQPIAKLDPKDYQVQLQEAQADLERSKAQLIQGDAQITQAEAQMNQAEAQCNASKAKFDNSERIFQRNIQLYQGKSVISRQDLDNSQFQFEGDKATYNSSEAAVKAAKAGLETAKAQRVAVVAQVDASRAALDNAQLQFSYTTLHAPTDGRIAKKSVETGQRVQPGQQLLAVVEPYVWIVANYKETQLGRIRPRQEVEIPIDAVKGKKFKGRVDSFQPGTGAVFALLPGDNATGNFTKIVQRVPVKIVFDLESIKGYEDRIVPGLSAVSAIKVIP
jgi:membrane fusion protein (multidrug efflux system)